MQSQTMTMLLLKTIIDDLLVYMAGTELLSKTDIEDSKLLQSYVFDKV